MLETPGVRKALQLLPVIRPVSCQMVFGYEVGDGTSEKAAYRGQRPDFNWRLAEAGGGIILDMCHEAYLSHALFGTTERLSAVARLLVPERISTETAEPIRCEVEDYAAIRRQHTSGVVNHSVWTWFRRINSEFGPLEITVEGREGTIVFGLKGLKLQRKEAAPAVRWEDLLEGVEHDWRSYWERPEVPEQDAFAVELERFIRSFLLREPYPYDATRALDWLGEVEAIYQSAAAGGQPVSHQQFLHYPDRVPPDWTAERLEGHL
jgi:predicted dehydrogenase